MQGLRCGIAIVVAVQWNGEREAAEAVIARIRQAFVGCGKALIHVRGGTAQVRIFSVYKGGHKRCNVDKARAENQEQPNIRFLTGIGPTRMPTRIPAPYAS